MKALLNILLPGSICIACSNDTNFTDANVRSLHDPSGREENVSTSPPWEANSLPSKKDSTTDKSAEASAVTTSGKTVEKSAFRFRIVDELTTTSGEAVDIVFVIDNSASMNNKIKRLHTSVNKFAERMALQKSTGSSFKTVMLSDFVSMLNGDFTFDSKKTFSNFLWDGLVFNYEVRDNVLQSSSFNPYKFHTLNYQQEWNSVANLDREPMLAAAMAYLNNRSLIERKEKKDKLPVTHLILLSDEDNDLDLIPGTSDATNQQIAYHTDYYYLSQTTPSSCAQRKLDLPGQPYIYRLYGETLCKDPKFDPEMMHQVWGEQKVWVCQSEMTIKKSKAEIQAMSSSVLLTANTRPEQIVHCNFPEAYRCYFKSDGSAVSETVWYPFYLNIEKNKYARCEAVKETKFDKSSENTLSTWSTEILGTPPMCAPATCDFAYESPKYTLSFDGARIKNIKQEPCSTGLESIKKPSASWLKTQDFCPKELPDGINSKFESNFTITARDDKTGLQRHYVNVATPTTKADVLQLLANKLNTIESNLTVNIAPTLPRQGFTSDSEGFLKFLKIVHPGLSIKIHSIINLNGRPCVGEESTSGNVALGKQYKSVSEATGGIIFDICQPNFDGFLTALADQVSAKRMNSYPLSKIIPTSQQSLKVTAIRNITSKEDLPATAWRIDGDILTIDNSKITTGDEILLITE